MSTNDVPAVVSGEEQQIAMFSCLVALYNAGESVEQLAGRFNLTVEHVRFGLAWMRGDIDEVERLANAFRAQRQARETT